MPDPCPALGKYLLSRPSNEERYGRKIEARIGWGNEFTTKALAAARASTNAGDPEKIITDAQWRKVMATDADGVFFRCRAAIPHIWSRRKARS
jgi:NAD(P)-dependent dehydrogenase (short-subunit alcohol dehydrogenase family)